ncbi:MAG: hypothetical protein DWQ04_16915 [Chloroflexi bacterium]|nr:MAG: hypothetical protein DWQ04_16915 [Chloroflexota bacterium]
MNMTMMMMETEYQQCDWCGNGRSPQQRSHATTAQATNCRTPKGSNPEIGLLPFSLSKQPNFSEEDGLYYPLNKENLYE